MRFSGTVTRGEGRAGKLGYPTVNIPLADPSVSGIYAGTVAHKLNLYHAVIFADPARGILEAHLIDFEEDLYDQTITVELLEKLRGTKKFDDDASLQAAIEDDVNKTEQYFEKKT